MVKIEMTYVYFEGNDGNMLTSEERIEDVVNYFQENNSIVLDDGKECKNETELRDALAKHENLEGRK